jgi:Fe-S-cluster-containing hydrogenase component 2
MAADFRREDSTASTVVLLCRDLQTKGNGLDLGRLCHWLEHGHENLQVQATADLCHAAGEVRRVGDAGVRHVILGLCALDYSEVELHAEARKAGIDPLGIEAVSLGAFCSQVIGEGRGTEKAKLLLAGAIAKVRAYPGSTPENIKPCLAPLTQKVSRRALFTLPPIQYQVVASVDGRRCAADTGCSLCVQACPRGALASAGGNIEVRRLGCDGCGNCLAACPKDAIRLPGCSPAEIEAQIGALLTAGSTRSAGDLPERRVLFTCRKGIPAIAWEGSGGVGASPCWLPVVVPCAGMVPAGWILSLVASGVPVGLTACGDACFPGQRVAVEERIGYCREVLRSFGCLPGLVCLVGPEREPEQNWAEAMLRGPDAARSEAAALRTPMFNPAALGQAFRMLKEKYGAPSTLSLEHPGSPAGVVEVDSELCTMCGVCAEACPTGALTIQRDEKQVDLVFDGSRCVACEQCLPVCPENVAGAIAVKRSTDFARLTEGPVTLCRDREARCESCGAPVASLSMLSRIESLLGEEDAALVRHLGRYCLSCKGNPAGRPA